MNWTWIKKLVYFIAVVFVIMMIPAAGASAETAKCFTVNVQNTKESYKYNEEVPYKVAVKNNSKKKAVNVVTKVTIPDNIKILKSDGKIEGQTITWNNNLINADESVNHSYSLKVEKNEIVPVKSVTKNTVTTLPKTGGIGAPFFIIAALITILLGVSLFKKDMRKATLPLAVAILVAGALLFAGKVIPVNAQDTNVTENYSHTIKIGDSNVESKFAITAFLAEEANPVKPVAGKAIVCGKVVEADNDTDLTNNKALENVKMTLTNKQTKAQYNPVNTDKNGQYKLDKIAPGTYALSAEKQGYKTVSKNVTVNNSDNSITIETIEMLQNDIVGIGRAEGQINDAFDGKGIKGITINIKKNENGNVVKTLTTDNNGKYSVDLETGNYYAEVVDNRPEIQGQKKYVANHFIIKTIANQIIGNQNCTLTPVLEAQQIRVVLTWGENPSDLDSHLVGPAKDGKSKFHVYFAEKKYLDVAALDHDDTTSYGPETITVYKPVTAGTYSYYVHDYSNALKNKCDLMSKSGAVVKVYVGDKLVKTYNVPSKEGTLWHVFDYDQASRTFKDINSMSYQENEVNVGK
ncbi:carboxypeptidase regulatory-like domain-containing protein [Inconstantimicrobium porci]|uniref:LPXTG cell wall anchor domain-containing protein n=1 Tax=Inconstantimicrobium porci TaxID=2652291 RepID=A0A7X2T1Z2_9CLOT|nr:carboxypeptidase regulatory-like domain-containing protein [Inconstantimicrobium porci]MSR92221.1 LPXTG cell wall anchor domain-containing protein [Inconstantimicrobium porci]